MMVRAKAIAQVGPMDEGYWMYCEEIDWCWRLRRDAAGARLVPVVITPPTPPAPTTALELAVADVRLRIEVGTDTRYVAALVAALRAC